MSRSYELRQFESALELMLKTAKSGGQDFLNIVSKELHDRVVTSSENRMPMACQAMWNLWERQGASKERIVHTTPSGQSTTIEIKFKTSI